MLRDASLMAFIATADAEACRAFYEGVLGLDVVMDTPFALVFDAHGTVLRAQKVEIVTPAPYTALGWEVTGIEDQIRALTGKGVAMLRFDGMEQDELGIWTTPGGAKVAWFNDPDGNVLSLTEAPD
ncbi:MAG: VOC family protein [Alphaproteobacteria bacterium]